MLASVSAAMSTSLLPSVVDPEVAEQYLPIIHLVFANLKTWLIGIHHGVSHQHLQAYLNEFTFRFNRRFYPFNAFRSLLGIAATPLLQPMPSFTRESGGTLHVAVMGVNRIGKVGSTGGGLDATRAAARPG